MQDIKEDDGGCTTSSVDIADKPLGSKKPEKRKVPLTYLEFIKDFRKNKSKE